jgi:hypothetical protein
VLVVQGTRLKTPVVDLTIATPIHESGIVRVDYPARTLWIQPALNPDHLVGRQVELGNDQHRTSYGVLAARREGERTAVVLDKALDLSYAHVLTVDENADTVTTNIGPVLPSRAEHGYTCTTTDMSKSWRCSAVGHNRDRQYVYKLQGDVTTQDLPPDSVLRLWEVGVGDTLRLPTTVSIRREGGKYVVDANVEHQLNIRPHPRR